MQIQCPSMSFNFLGPFTVFLSYMNCSQIWTSRSFATKCFLFVAPSGFSAETFAGGAIKVFAQNQARATLLVLSMMRDDGR